MDKNKIAKTLRELRGNRSMNEVANAVGVTVAAISNYEAGERVPSDDIKIKLARYFERTVESIFYQ